MRGIVAFLVVAAWCGNAVPAKAVDPEPGNWKLIAVSNPQVDIVECILNLDKDGTTWSAKYVAPAITKTNEGRAIKIKSATVANGVVTIMVQRGTVNSTVEVVMQDGKNGKGTIGDDRRVTPVKLLWTEDDKLEPRSMQIRKSAPEPMEELAKMQVSMNQLFVKLRAAKEDDEKKDLQKQLTEQQKELEAARPEKLRQVIADHADHPAAMDAAVMLFRGAAKNEATEAEARNWAKIALKVAGEYGAKYRLQTQLEAAEAALQSPALHPVAAELARQADAELGPNGPPAKLVRALTTLVYASGNGANVKPIAARLETLELKLDAEYATKHDFKIEPYAGRKDGGNRTMLLELFTGAQCPPCVASDIAFDKLVELYKPTDVIAMQYHLHIPGPDPMTNTDSEARYKYYTKAYPRDPADREKPGVGGVPCALFNGQLDPDPMHGGGGGEERAPVKLKQFREMIDPVLDEKADAKLGVTAKRVGDVVTVTAQVTGLEASSSRKLRFAIVEDAIRYQGGNGIRFHHHVVRAMPGGADGMELGSPNEARQASVNLTELRGTLTTYLDDFVKNRGPFPKPNRPLDFKNLKAIAWIQDDGDEHHLVLQATMVDVR